MKLQSTEEKRGCTVLSMERPGLFSAPGQTSCSGRRGSRGPRGAGTPQRLWSHRAGLGTVATQKDQHPDSRNMPAFIRGDRSALKCSPIPPGKAWKTQRRAPPFLGTTARPVMLRVHRGGVGRARWLPQASTSQRLQTRDTWRRLPLLRGELGARPRVSGSSCGCRDLFVPRSRECNASEDAAGRLGRGGLTVAVSFKLSEHQDARLEERESVFLERKDCPARPPNPWRISVCFFRGNAR